MCIKADTDEARDVALGRPKAASERRWRVDAESDGVVLDNRPADPLGAHLVAAATASSPSDLRLGWGRSGVASSTRPPTVHGAQLAGVVARRTAAAVVVDPVPFRLLGPASVLLGVRPGSIFEDFGAECHDSSGHAANWTANPGVVPLNSPGVTKITYSCNLVGVAPLTRTVTVISEDPTPVLHGPALPVVHAGEHYTEPGACCRMNVSGQVQELQGAFLSGIGAKAGAWASTIAVSCPSVFGAGKLALRTVRVNQPPSLALRGPAKTTKLAYLEHFDEGAHCVDIEDGDVKAWDHAGLGDLVPLPAWRAGCSESVSGKCASVLEESAGEAGDQACASCAVLPSVDVGGSLWVDLGAQRVVHTVRLVGTWSRVRVYVGDTPPEGWGVQGRLCNIEVTPGASLRTKDVDCLPPVIGRYVLVQSDSSSATICRVQVAGTLGPGMLGEVNMTNGTQFEEPVGGRYVLMELKRLGPVYKDPAGRQLYRKQRSAKRSLLKLPVTLSGTSLRLPTTAFQDAFGNETANWPRNLSVTLLRGGQPLWSGMVIIGVLSGFPVVMSQIARSTVFDPGGAKLTAAQRVVNADVLELNALGGWYRVSDDQVLLDEKPDGTWTFTAILASSTGAIGHILLDFVSGLTIGKSGRHDIQVFVGDVKVLACSQSATASYQDYTVTTTAKTAKYKTTQFTGLRVQREGLCAVSYLINGDASNFLASQCGMNWTKPLSITWKNSATDKNSTLNVKSVQLKPWLWRLVDVPAFKGGLLLRCGDPGKVLCASQGVTCTLITNLAGGDRCNTTAPPYARCYGVNTYGSSAFLCSERALLAADGSDPCEMLGCYQGQADGEPGHDEWVIQQPDGVVTHAAPGGGLIPPTEGWVRYDQASDDYGPASTVTPTPAVQSCPWLWGSGNATHQVCADGFRCSAPGCCRPTHGGVIMCPSSTPRMCSRKCGGDYCCIAKCPIEFLRLCNQQPRQEERVRESCTAHLRAGATASGRYAIRPASFDGPPFVVYCDMETAGGGWTIIGAVNGSRGSPSFTEEETLPGFEVDAFGKSKLRNPFAFDAYTLSIAEKFAIAAQGRETLFVAGDGRFLVVDAPVLGNGSMTAKVAVTVQTSTGTTAAADMSWSVIGGTRGSFFLTPTGPLNQEPSAACRYFLMSVSSVGAVPVFEVGAALTDWPATGTCAAGAAPLQFYVAIREGPAATCGIVRGRSFVGEEISTTSGASETHTAFCQRLCQLTAGCAYYIHQPTSANKCRLLRTRESEQRANATTVSGPVMCPLARIYRATSVIGLAMNVGVWSTCLDSSGAVDFLGRDVSTQCETPVPASSPTCSSEMVTVSVKATNPDECAKGCLENPTCEGVIFVKPNGCHLQTKCKGGLSPDSPSWTTVYCRRNPTPPTLLISDFEETIGQNETWPEPTVGCSSSGLVQVADTWRQQQSVSTAIVGVQKLSYICTDLLGLQHVRNFDVTVIANCKMPTVQDASIKGPCGDGTTTSLVYDRTCRVACRSGFRPTQNEVNCSWINKTGFAGELVPSLPACTSATCPLSSLGSIPFATSPLCGRTSDVPSGGSCLAKCQDGYVANETRLPCIPPTTNTPYGTFVPPRWKCLKTASSPRLWNNLGPDPFSDVLLTWQPGSWLDSDCLFAKWQLEWKEKSSAADFRAIVNDVFYDSKTTSYVHGLRKPGVTYLYRLAVICTNPLVNSTFTSIEFKQPILLPPTKLVAVPAEGKILSAQKTWIIVWDQLVKPGYGNWIITRFFDLADVPACKNESRILPEGLFPPVYRGPGERISLFNLGTDFLVQGCKYESIVEWGYVQMHHTFSLPNEEIRWVVDFLDLPPILESIYVRDQKVGVNGVNLSVVVHYSRPAVYSCKISPTAPDTEPVLAGDWPGPALHQEGVVIRSLRAPELGITIPGIRQEFIDQTQTVQVSGLVPNKGYQVSCAGHAPGKFWVPIICSGRSEVCSPTALFTSVDQDRELDEAVMYVHAVCDDGSVRLSGEERRRLTFTSNFSVFLTHWEEACLQAGAKRLPGESAVLRTSFFVKPRSRYASVLWGSSPRAELTYTVPHSGDGPVVQEALAFQVCSNEDDYVTRSRTNCHSYGLRVNFRDLAIRNVVLSAADRAGSEIQKSDSKAVYELNVGTKMTLQMSVSETVSIDELSVLIGRPGGGFVQNMLQRRVAVSGAFELEFQAAAVGIRLPLYIMWHKDDISVPFLTAAVITCRDPSWSATPVEVDYRFGTRVEVSVTSIGLSSLPSIMEAPEVVLRYARIAVIRPGMESPGLCIGQQRWQVTSLGTIQLVCDLVPVPFADLEVVVEFYNAASGEFEFALTAGRDFNFKRPSLQAFSYLGVGGGVDLSALVYSGGDDSSVTLVLSGDGFPDPANLRAAVAGVRYELVMFLEDGASHTSRSAEGGDSRSFSLCDDLQAESHSRLLCKVSQCIDGRGLGYAPRVKLIIADLVSEALSGQVRLPMPYLTGLTPVSASDIGTTKFEMQGFFFGEPLGNDEPLGSACAAWRQRRADAAHIQVFKSREVRVGLAPCNISYQADGFLNCTTTKPLRTPWGTALGDDGKPILINAFVNISIDGHVLDRRLDTILKRCGAGQARGVTGDCVSCALGKYSNTNSPGFPVSCTECPDSTFADRPGMANCRACPENTASFWPRANITDCRCLPGYYSPMLDSDQLTAIPGKACLKCHSDELTRTPPRGLRCAEDAVIKKTCVDAHFPSCATVAGQSQTFVMCTVFCPGGVVWPKAKPWFYIAEKRLADANAEGSAGRADAVYRPVINSCVPREACGLDNRCATGYAGKSCGECLFGYFRDKLSGKCAPCDDNQIVGMVMLTSAAVSLTLGSFVFMLFSLKMLYDPIFKELLLLKITRLADEMCLSRVAFLRRYWLLLRARTVEITAKQCSSYWPYHRSKSMGLVLRVDDGVIHVAGVMHGSPAEMAGIKAGWKLVLVNGLQISGHEEWEIVGQIATRGLPVRLSFLGRRFNRAEGSSDDSVEAVKVTFDNTGGIVNSTSAVRVATVSWGVLQSLNYVVRLQLTWPEIFNKIATALQAPYEQRWMALILVPYLLLIPLALAYGCMRLQARASTRNDPQARETQKWLLDNAVARMTLGIVIVFIQMHMDLLIAPFNCIKRADGTVAMSLAQDITCDSTDWRWLRLYRMAICFSALLSAVMLLIIYALGESFNWQVGTRLRNKIPWHVAMFETAAEDMKGHVETVRARVYHNIVNVRTFHAESLSQGPTKRRTNKRKHSSNKAGAEISTTNEVRADTNEAQENLHISRLIWPDVIHGSALTYGWVILVNTVARQFLLMFVVMRLSNSYAPIGAAAQSMVFIANVAGLLVFRPYVREVLNTQEALMIGGLGVVTFLAMFRELLIEHKRAQDYPNVVRHAGMLIDAIVIFVIVIIVVGLCTNFYTILSCVLSKQDRDDWLNEAYFRNRQRRNKLKQEDFHGQTVGVTREGHEHIIADAHTAQQDLEDLLTFEALEVVRDVSDHEAAQFFGRYDHLLTKMLGKHIFPSIETALRLRVAAVAADFDHFKRGNHAQETGSRKFAKALRRVNEADDTMSAELQGILGRIAKKERAKALGLDADSRHKKLPPTAIDELAASTPRAHRVTRRNLAPPTTTVRADHRVRLTSVGSKTAPAEARAPGRDHGGAAGVEEWLPDSAISSRTSSEFASSTETAPGRPANSVGMKSERKASRAGAESQSSSNSARLRRSHAKATATAPAGSRKPSKVREGAAARSRPARGSTSEPAAPAARPPAEAGQCEGQPRASAAKRPKHRTADSEPMEQEVDDSGEILGRQRSRSAELPSSRVAPSIRISSPSAPQSRMTTARPRKGSSRQRTAENAPSEQEHDGADMLGDVSRRQRSLGEEVPRSSAALAARTASPITPSSPRSEMRRESPRATTAPHRHKSSRRRTVESAPADQEVGPELLGDVCGRQRSQSESALLKARRRGNVDGDTTSTSERMKKRLQAADVPRNGEQGVPAKHSRRGG